MKTSERQTWQADPNQVTTERVQFWSKNGIMVTGQMKNSEAREHVKAGRAFVITSQAIGQCD